MLIKKTFSDYAVPLPYQWILPILFKARHYQENVIKVKHPFTYLTIRSGTIQSSNDDVWHVDGFSTRITHLPEQNYIWCNNNPTEYLEEEFNFPPDFNPEKHNIHYFFQDNTKTTPKIAKPNTIYCLDPYVVHRRPQGTQPRTFVRLSFTPIEIMDDNNTPNPYIPMPKYNMNGIQDFRDKLERYETKTK